MVAKQVKIVGWARFRVAMVLEQVAADMDGGWKMEDPRCMNYSHMIRNDGVRLRSCPEQPSRPSDCTAVGDRSFKP